MIPAAYIREWRNMVPWHETDMIEQDLVICRALIEIFNDSYLAENMAFRGGTAIHKLFLNCYREYMKFVVAQPPTQKQFLHNMEDKMADDDFLGDIKSLLRPDEKYDPNKAWELVKTELVERI